MVGKDKIQHCNPIIILVKYMNRNPPKETVFSRWIFLLMEFRSFPDLLGFMLVLEAAFGFLEAHTGMHLARHCCF